MEFSYLYEEAMPLPRSYSVVIYHSTSRNGYVLEVLKKRGIQITHGGPHYPKWIMFSSLNDKAVAELKEMGVELDKKKFVLYGSADFVNLIEMNPFFSKLADDIRRSSRMPERK